MEKKVQLNLYLSESKRDQLRRLAAQKNFKDPSKTISACAVAVKIIEEYLGQENLKNQSIEGDIK